MQIASIELKNIRALPMNDFKTKMEMVQRMSQ